MEHVFLNMSVRWREIVGAVFNFSSFSMGKRKPSFKKHVT